MKPWHVRAHELVSVKAEKDGFEFQGSPILGLKDRSERYHVVMCFFENGAANHS